MSKIIVALVISLSLVNFSPDKAEAVTPSEAVCALALVGAYSLTWLTVPRNENSVLNFWPLPPRAFRGMGLPRGWAFLGESTSERSLTYYSKQRTDSSVVPRYSYVVDTDNQIGRAKTLILNVYAQAGDNQARSRFMLESNLYMLAERLKSKIKNRVRVNVNLDEQLQFATPNAQLKTSYWLSLERSWFATDQDFEFAVRALNSLIKS